MPKFEVTVDCNQTKGFQTFGIEAPDRETALSTFYDGDIIFEEHEIGWDISYGEQPEPEIEEVEEFNFGYYQKLEIRNKKLKMELDKARRQACDWYVELRYYGLSQRLEEAKKKALEEGWDCYGNDDSSSGEGNE